MIKVFLKRNNIYLLAGLASIFFTVLFLTYKQPLDPDGIGYLNAASVFLSQGLKACFTAYHWPFYSILIAITSSITHLSLLSAAHILDAALDIVTVIVFIMFLKELGGSCKLQFLGAFIILTYPYLNHFRYQAMRGHGYYAFCLLALLFLVHYSRSFKWRYAIGWGVSIVLATLFRIEGVLLVCFLPLVLLFNPKFNIGRRFIYLVKAYTVQIILLLGLVFLLVINAQHVSSYSGRIPELMNQFIHGLAVVGHNLQAKANFLAHSFFTHPSSAKYANLAFLIGGLLGLGLAVVIATFRLLYVVLSCYALKQKLITWDFAAKSVWIGAVVLNIIVILIFMGQMFFVVNRYVALLCLLLLLTVPFAIAQIYANYRKIFILVIIAFIYVVLGGVYHFGTSKTYIVESGQWINKNTATTSQLYVNDGVLFYYSKRPGLYGKSYTVNLEKYDYLAVEISRHDLDEESKVLQYVKRKPVKVFHNRKGDKVLIFKLK